MNWKNLLIGLFISTAALVVSYPLSVRADLEATTAQLLDELDPPIWDHLSADFSLRIDRTHPGVANQRATYLRHAAYLKNTINRATPYLYMINQELEKRHLPSELVILPIIESAYDPDAVSSRNAAGLWQMIPSTARNYGLKQNRFYDGRHDVYASTQAALNYIVKLNKQFKGDWLLTLAAYNAGEGAVARAIQKNYAQGKSTDFWSLSLPMQTRVYVQRFLALADIIGRADEYGFELPEVPNRPMLMIIQLQKQTDLNRAAEIAGISLRELYDYNPGFINHGNAVTPPTGQYHLVLPINRIRTVTPPTAAVQHTAQKASGSGAPLALAAADETGRRINYRVKEGDTLTRIAGLFNTSASQLQHWNTQLADASMLHPGQLLTVYIQT